MTDGHASRSRALHLWVVFGVIALVVVAIDQASKSWIESSFTLAAQGAAPGSAGAGWCRLLWPFIARVHRAEGGQRDECFGWGGRNSAFGARGGASTGVAAATARDKHGTRVKRCGSG